MFPRFFKPPKKQSFFLLGPRGVGKTSWIREHFGSESYIDLLKDETFNALITHPDRLSHLLTRRTEWVIIDEIQRAPNLLNEVHRLIENEKMKFILTGSSARKLRRGGANLLGGRALSMMMYPLTAGELSSSFELSKSVSFGHLPMSVLSENPHAYLQSYVSTYLKEEVMQEGLTRNLSHFARFLEAASFSQAQQLNVSKVAADCHIERKVVGNYFEILEDLLLGIRLPLFTRRAKRTLTTHPKFFYFDCGLYQALRPKGPLDSQEEIDGPAWETLIFQEIRAMNDYLALEYQIYYWGISRGPDVDLVLYGKHGLIAIEVKRTDRLRGGELLGLETFLEDYPVGRGIFVYGGKQKIERGKITIVPIEEFLADIQSFLKTK